MNKNRWTKEDRLPILALKLCEEAAEVGGEISDAETKYGHPDNWFYARALEELDHVEFIAYCLRARIQEKLQAN